MIWEPWLPQSKAIPPGLQVFVEARPDGARFRSHLVVGVTPGLIATGLRWFVHGAAVSVDRGMGADGEHIRVRRGGALRISAPMGRGIAAGNFGAARLRLVDWPGLPKTATMKLACEFDYGDDWLDVTLPWTAPAAAKPAAALVAPAAGKPGFSMLEDGLPKTIGRPGRSVLG